MQRFLFTSIFRLNFPFRDFFSFSDLVHSPSEGWGSSTFRSGNSSLGYWNSCLGGTYRSCSSGGRCTALSLYGRCYFGGRCRSFPSLGGRRATSCLFWALVGGLLNCKRCGSPQSLWCCSNPNPRYKVCCSSVRYRLRASIGDFNWKSCTLTGWSRIKKLEIRSWRQWPLMDYGFEADLVLHEYSILRYKIGFMIF